MSDVGSQLLLLRPPRSGLTMMTSPGWISLVSSSGLAPSSWPCHLAHFHLSVSSSALSSICGFCLLGIGSSSSAPIVPTSAIGSSSAVSFGPRASHDLAALIGTCRYSAGRGGTSRRASFVRSHLHTSETSGLGEVSIPCRNASIPGWIMGSGLVCAQASMWVFKSNGAWREGAAVSSGKSVRVPCTPTLNGLPIPYRSTSSFHVALTASPYTKSDFLDFKTDFTPRIQAWAGEPERSS